MGLITKGLLTKGIVVIRSCQTIDQLNVAKKYIKLLINNMKQGNIGMKSLIEILTIHKELEYLILEKQKEILK